MGKNSLKYSLLTALLFTFFVSQAKARIGDGGLVGNGAGVVENQIPYAYVNLANHINECLRLAICDLASSEADIMKKILEVTRQKRLGDMQFEFLSEKEYPGFFHTAPGEYHRIAKTLPEIDSLIYFNRDQLYDEDGNPSLSYGQLTAILIHELGHIAGFENHELLDILGTKVRVIVEQSVKVFSLADNKSSLNIWIINFSSKAALSEIYEEKQGELKSLNHYIFDKVTCPAGYSLSGWNFSNPHFDRPKYDPAGSILKFYAWLNATCVDQNMNLMTNYFDLEYTIYPSGLSSLDVSPGRF